MKRTFRNTDHSNVMKDDSKNVSFLLPKRNVPLHPAHTFIAEIQLFQVHN